MGPADSLPFHAALAAALNRAGVSHGELARRLGKSQPAVSAWVSGRTTPSVHEVPVIEDAIGVRRGTVLGACGYVTAPEGFEMWLVAIIERSPRELVERDPRLNELGRAIVAAAWDSARSHPGSSDVDGRPDR